MSETVYTVAPLFFGIYIRPSMLYDATLTHSEQIDLEQKDAKKCGRKKNLNTTFSA